MITGSNFVVLLRHPSEQHFYNKVSPGENRKENTVNYPVYNLSMTYFPASLHAARGENECRRPFLRRKKVSLPKPVQ